MTVTLDTDEEHINVLYIPTYSWKEDLPVLMLQVSRIATKDQNFNLEAR